MTTERIEEKIRKLLALAGDKAASEHEAASAAAAAQRLMIEYQIDKAKFAADPKNKVEVEVIEKEILESTNGGNVKHWRSILANNIAPFFYCDTYYVSRNGIIIVGRQHDRQTLAYLYAYLTKTLERLCERSWEKNKRSTLAEGREYKRAFYMGAVQVIVNRLALNNTDTLLQAGVTAETALALRNRLATVHDYLKVAAPDLKNTPNRSLAADTHDAYNEGKAAGHSVNLNGGGEGLPSGVKRLGGRS